MIVDGIFVQITFIFILILFIDSVNRVYRVQQELSAYAKDGSAVGYVNLPQANPPKLANPSWISLIVSSFPRRRAATLGTERMEVQARKFYSQRNMYLCGFTLFLSLILNRTYIMILEILQLEEKVKQYKQDQGKGTSEEVARLKKEIASRDTDIQILKKQCEGLTSEYHKLGDQVMKESKDTPKKDL